VLAGRPLVLSGRLSSRLPAQRIAILARPYGRSAPVRIGTLTTAAAGAWRFTARPGVQTTYSARWRSSTTSPTVTVGVRPALTVKELANGRVLIEASARRSLRGSAVRLQRLVGGAWRTVRAKPLGSASIAVFAPALPTSTIRAALSVNQAGAGLLGSTSDGLVYRPRTITMNASATKVLYGRPLTLSGRVLNAPADARVAIVARRYGSSSPSTIGTVALGERDGWKWDAAPAIQTTYVARAVGTSSRPTVVGVRPLVGVRELSNGHVWTEVKAGRSFAGRKVQLQQLMRGGAWQTLAEKRLGRSSTAVFAPALPGSTVRVAFSVNQAGKGSSAARATRSRTSRSEARNGRASAGAPPVSGKVSGCASSRQSRSQRSPGSRRRPSRSRRRCARRWWARTSGTAAVPSRSRSCGCCRCGTSASTAAPTRAGSS
jgi:hypothetical protein